MSKEERYEIIFIPGEGRAIKDNYTKRIFSSEFSIIEELQKENKQLKERIEEIIKYKIIVETLKKKIKDDFANQLEPTGKEMLDLIEELEKGEENGIMD